MSDSENQSEKDRKMDADLPAFKIRHNDMPIRLVKDVVRQLDVLLKKYTMDKDICVELVKFIRGQPQFKVGEGEWQVIIGNNFGCSLTYDLHVLTFIEFGGKSVLLFKSG